MPVGQRRLAERHVAPWRSSPVSRIRAGVFGIHETLAAHHGRSDAHAQRQRQCAFDNGEVVVLGIKARKHTAQVHGRRREFVLVLDPDQVDDEQPVEPVETLEVVVVGESRDSRQQRARCRRRLWRSRP